MNRKATSGVRGGWRLAVAFLAAIMVGLLGVLLTQGSAEAHDHRIPDTVLKKGAKNLQTGRRVIDSRWSSPSGDECVSITTYYTFDLPGDKFNYPEAHRVAASRELRVRIFKAQRPDFFSVAAYPKIDGHGNPSGQGRLLERTLKRVVIDGKTVAWDAVFSVDRPDRHYYLIGEGHWQDRQGCGGDQHAHWSFHVKTRA